MLLFIVFSSGAEVEDKVVCCVMGGALGVVVLANVVKRCNSFIGKVIKILIMVTLVDVIGIMLGANLAVDVSSALLCIGIVSSVSMVLIILLLHVFTNLYEEYVARCLIINKTIRYMLLPGICMLNYWGIELGTVKYFLIITILLVGVEYFYVNFKSNKFLVAVTIHLRAGQKVTQDLILQYKDNKVRYIDIDGTKEIISSKDIMVITYKYKNIWNHWFAEDEQVRCTFKSGDVKDYSRYAYRNEEWIALYKDIENYTEVETYHSSLIDNISKISKTQERRKNIPRIKILNSLTHVNKFIIENWENIQRDY